MAYRIERHTQYIFILATWGNLEHLLYILHKLSTIDIITKCVTYEPNIKKCVCVHGL